LGFSDVTIASDDRTQSCYWSKESISQGWKSRISKNILVEERKEDGCKEKWLFDLHEQLNVCAKNIDCNKW